MLTFIAFCIKATEFLCFDHVEKYHLLLQQSSSLSSRAVFIGPQPEAIFLCFDNTIEHQQVDLSSEKKENVSFCSTVKKCLKRLNSFIPFTSLNLRRREVAIRHERLLRMLSIFFIQIQKKIETFWLALWTLCLFCLIDAAAIFEIKSFLGRDMFAYLSCRSGMHKGHACQGTFNVALGTALSEIYLGVLISFFRKLFRPP